MEESVEEHVHSVTPRLSGSPEATPSANGFVPSAFALAAGAQRVKGAKAVSEATAETPPTNSRRLITGGSLRGLTGLLIACGDEARTCTMCSGQH
ncbi:MAG: hypothetical protein QM778_28225 [Myxococcales bacterium]